jgi:two-component system, chemotaxis family, CheB/CheR fusion protein
VKKRSSPRQSAASRKRSRTATKPHLARFPLVGIGASAGGLPAFLSLLEHLPAHTGMAFVLVQHLPPTHESILPGLLAKATAMPVLEAAEGLELEPDHVYVSPPGVGITFAREALHLHKREAPRQRLRLIDDFLSSLAEATPGRAIGVILSGTGADGTRGLQAIHKAGGTTLVQEPASASFDGMPWSAIASGCVDHVLPPEGIAGALAQIANVPAHPPGPSAPELASPVPMPEEGLRQVFQLLRNAVGVDFTHYKPTTIHRRLERRMLLCKVAQLGDYVRYLHEHPEELELLHQDLLIHVTSFFRDPATFEVLQRKILPQLFENRPRDLPFRLWVPGCSTGEEAYSLVISLLEYLGPAAATSHLQVFATDLSGTAIEHARTAIYPPSIATSVSPERLNRFFVRVDGGYQITKSVRALCVFAQQNLVSDPPFSQIDLISCRNVLIYLGPVLQRKVLPIFHYALRPEGFLVLGSSESVGAAGDLFSLVDKRCKIYRKKTFPSRPGVLFTYRDSPAEKPTAARRKPEPTAPLEDPQKEADRLVLARYGPPGVIINGDMEILHFRGHTGPYLEPIPGAASLNLLKLVRNGLALELRAVLHRAKKSARRVRKEGLLLSGADRPRQVNLEVHPLYASQAGREPCFLVLFEEGQGGAAALPQKGRRRVSHTRGGAAQRELERLREELITTREHLQTLLEQQEATAEELRSATEETQSSNEELQSTNEELETAKEELQSTNEELTTVNEELENRNLELSQLNSDLNNLIGSTHIVTVMVDNHRRIRRFTPMAAAVLRLSAGDIGRPIREVQAGLSLPDLETLLSDVIERLAVIEQEVCDRDGHWYSLRLRPYKTLDNRIDGAVMTLLDIDRLKRSLDEARKTREYAKAIVETMREPFLVLDAALHVLNANPAFYATFQEKQELTLGRPLYALGNGQWNIPRLRQLLEEILPLNTHLQDFVMEHDFRTIGHRRMLLNARRISNEELGSPYILLSLEDITSQ